MERKALGKGFMDESMPGRGLAALVPQSGLVPGTSPQETAPQEGVQQIPIDSIFPNRYQPRQTFSHEALESLSASLKQHGLIQPITVRPEGDGKFELIAGERRWRASQMAGFTTIPALVRKIDDRGLMEFALLENLQREDLNPIEKAQAYAKLLSQFSLTQEEISAQIGIDRSSVANFLRLLQLPKVLWEDLAQGGLTLGHAKALLSLDHESDQIALAQQIKAETLSVRQTEALVKNRKAGILPQGARKSASKMASPEVDEIENRLRIALGTRAVLKPRGTKGEIRIEYYSLDDLDRILGKITSNPT